VRQRGGFYYDHTVKARPVLWRNDPAAYPFDPMSRRSPEFYSNRVMLGFAIISVVIALAMVVRF
jgi:hypothetical protein